MIKLVLDRLRLPDAAIVLDQMRLLDLSQKIRRAHIVLVYASSPIRQPLLREIGVCQPHEPCEDLAPRRHGIRIQCPMMLAELDRLRFSLAQICEIEGVIPFSFRVHHILQFDEIVSAVDLDQAALEIELLEAVGIGGFDTVAIIGAIVVENVVDVEFEDGGEGAEVLQGFQLVGFAWTFLTTRAIRGKTDMDVHATGRVNFASYDFGVTQELERAPYLFKALARFVLVLWRVGVVGVLEIVERQHARDELEGEVLVTFVLFARGGELDRAVVLEFPA